MTALREREWHMQKYSSMKLEVGRSKWGDHKR